VKSSRRAFVAGASGLALAGCRRPSAGALAVLSAASLREAITAIAAAFKRERGVEVRPVFDGTPRLARQILEGAAADVFVSADEAWMDDVEKKGALAAGTRVDLAASSLVVVVRGDATDSPVRLGDLAGVRRLALAGENVPAGRYARSALRAAGVWDAVAPRVASGDSVRVALEWVARGEADAAVVYASDPRVEPRVRVAFGIDEATHPPIRYPIAVLARAPRPDDARAFLSVARSPVGRAALTEAGLRPLP
jgi:molybdate transport system substrate-binding protein